MRLVVPQIAELFPLDCDDLDFLLSLVRQDLPACKADPAIQKAWNWGEILPLFQRCCALSLVILAVPRFPPPVFLSFQMTPWLHTSHDARDLSLIHEWTILLRLAPSLFSMSPQWEMWRYHIPNIVTLNLSQIQAKKRKLHFARPALTVMQTVSVFKLHTGLWSKEEKKSKKLEQFKCTLVSIQLYTFYTSDHISLNFGPMHY